jgi:hypothetical protein
MDRLEARRTATRESLSIVKLRMFYLIVVVYWIGSVRAEEPAGSMRIKRLRHATSWVGNSFAGNGGGNGEGFWVQNGADEIEVTPDGTVVAGVSWDEAGRCVGLYKDGHVNRVLLKSTKDNYDEDGQQRFSNANRPEVGGPRIW